MKAAARNKVLEKTGRRPGLLDSLAAFLQHTPAQGEVNVGIVEMVQKNQDQNQTVRWIDLT